MGQIAEELKSAVSVLDSRGWCRGYMVRPTTFQSCAFGAIAVAKGNIPKDYSLFTDDEIMGYADSAYEDLKEDPTILFFGQVCSELSGSETPCDCGECTIGDDIIGFNDSSTESDVREAFRYAIEKAELEGV